MADLDPNQRAVARTIRRMPILHDDAHIVAVDKPAGMLVAPDRYNSDEPTLVDELTERLHDEGKLAEDARLFVVHRIDKGASGVVVFAKDSDTHKAMSQVFDAHKTYEAIVHGEVASDAGRIDLPIGPASNDNARMVVRKRKGRESQTEFTVLGRYIFYTHLRLRPLTGRRHQLRVHLNAIGHPIVADALYGQAKGIYLSELKRSYRFKRDEGERPLLGRLALHAAEVRFKHPHTGQTIVAAAEQPKDFRAALRNLERFLRKRP